METQAFLREWAPLTELLNKLPTKTGGLFSQDIKLTNLDVLSDFLVIGTSVGIVFWFDRKKTALQRLRCENSNSPITFVKAVSTVDYMIACGNQTGSITIFQIPKTHSEALPAKLRPQKKQVERYTVDLHKSPITSLEWSKNGMKLYSGDKSGSVVLTEIDFYMHVCKSLEILNESYEVVQLSYKQQFLLISTTFRSVICQNVEKWKVCQVGKKDRKVLGKFGGIIHQTGFKPGDVVLYCMRPGLRIWIADVEGEVQKTLLFKDLLSKDCPQIPILTAKMTTQKEPCFGLLHEFGKNLLITHNSDTIYVLDPASMSIHATLPHLNILCVATYKDELFILDSDKKIIRISYRPEHEMLLIEPEEAQDALKEFRNFDEITDEDAEILFKKSRRIRKKKPDDVHSYTTPTLMQMSTVLPDLRSPETISNDIETKEKILWDVLNLERIQLKPQMKKKEEIVMLPEREESPVFEKRMTKSVPELPNAPALKIERRLSRHSTSSSLSDWEIV